jgi:hypothetical protein
MFKFVDSNSTLIPEIHPLKAQNLLFRCTTLCQEIMKSSAIIVAWI